MFVSISLIKFTRYQLKVAKVKDSMYFQCNLHFSLMKSKMALTVGRKFAEKELNYEKN